MQLFMNHKTGTTKAKVYVVLIPSSLGNMSSLKEIFVKLSLQKRMFLKTKRLSIIVSLTNYFFLCCSLILQNPVQEKKVQLEFLYVFSS